MPAFDDALARVKQLVADFKANENFYLSPQYQEQEARHDFIDKFWIALGWDVNHDTQKNPFEQEVKVERKEHGTSQRRADYAFYLLPNFRDVKFYVEAKKPHGDIATADNYFQAARYGWSSHTPLAVLHDFEQFEIIDCRYRPHIDTALAQNLRKYHYTQYVDPEKFAEIYWLFSREAVANGSLEKFAEALPKKRGKAVQRGLFPGAYQSIDEAFLEELDEHREALAKAFKNENADLDGETLTELVQRTLDRLVFLRFLEDKHIEPQNHIAYFGDKGSAWQDFIRESRRLDGIYNGIVYKQHPILDDPKFKPDDEIFSGICERLSHINSSYDFNAIPIHILGSIYERFLGKVISTTDKRAKVDWKPANRKANGVYYTPEYIVRYIVEGTVGKLIEGKSPAQIAELRFADIACGSGSFLLGVYDLLLRYHTKYYNEHPDEANLGAREEIGVRGKVLAASRKKSPACVMRDDGLHLSLQRKREILLHNIYGADIDAQAVEVAQLSLYLKLLQDETPGSTREHQLEFHEALLPSLNKNIVCGNSLIGTDILDGQLFASDEERKLNPMNFEDAFPHIFKRKSFNELKDASAAPLGFDLPGVPLHGSYSKKKLKNAPKAKLPPEFQGGFDAIVGNPPYLLLQPQNIEPAQLQYLQSHYRVAQYKVDIFHLFIERAISKTKDKGTIGYITPASFLTNNGTTKLREELLSNLVLQQLVVLPDGVFKEASVDNVLLIGQKEKQASARGNATTDFILAEVGNEKFIVHETIAAKQSEFTKNKGLIFRPFRTSGFAEIAESMEKQSVNLGSVARVNFGMQLRDRSKFPRDVLENPAKNEISAKHKKCLGGSDVQVYRTGYSGLYCLFDRVAQSGGCWDEEIQFAKRKMLVRQIGKTPIATLETEGRCCLNALFMIKAQNGEFDEAYFLGLVNSKLLQLYWSNKFYDFKDTFPKIKGSYLEELPIRKIDFAEPTDKSRHDQMVQLVEQMLEAKKQLAGAQTDKDRTYYEGKCNSLDVKIDALVYDLYGLTEAEIIIVDSAAA